jgi:hypothetical protein
MVDLVNGILTGLRGVDRDGRPAIHPINDSDAIADASWLDTSRYCNGRQIIGGGDDCTGRREGVVRCPPDSHFVMLKTHGGPL